MKRKLRKEKFKNYSGEVFRFNSIPFLKNENYCIQDSSFLDGDAPKEFIKAYFFERDSKLRRKKINTWNYYIAKSAENGILTNQSLNI